MNTWKSVYHVLQESEVSRLQRQANLIDKLGLPHLADDILKEKVPPLLDRIADHTAKS